MRTHVKKEVSSIAHHPAGSVKETHFEEIDNVTFSNSVTASVSVAREMADLIRKKQQEGKPCVLGLVTGSSPVKVYGELVRMHKEEGPSFKNIITFNLDEYHPMEKQDIQSYWYFMHEHLFNHINIPKENINMSDGTVSREELQAYCAGYDKKVEERGGINFQLLGIGRTGHIGFNEPGSNRNSGTRIITLDHITCSDAAETFHGIDNVPRQTTTMGIHTVMRARRIVLLAWGSSKASIVAKAVEGDITSEVPLSYLQLHDNTTFVLDAEAISALTCINTPWLVTGVQWNEDPKAKAIVWLCKHLGKTILKLTDSDYNENGMSRLLAESGPAYDLNIAMFNRLQHTITGWPGDKPNADDTNRPEREHPHKKRVIIFSPYPDDDAISMGDTSDCLVSQGHGIRIAYQTSGNFAVSDHEALKLAEVPKDIVKKNEGEAAILDGIISSITNKKSNEVDTLLARQLKGNIRRHESLAAARYEGVPDKHVHFLNLPFYETGSAKKNPIGKADTNIIMNLIERVKPHQMYAVSGLADPHGTHKVCLDAIFTALKNLKHKDYTKDCRAWLYRDAWYRWDMHEIEMAVPMSPTQVLKKCQATFFHQSQKDGTTFRGDDLYEFWQRAEARNSQIAQRYRSLGLANYEAIEAFKRYLF